MAWWGRLRVEGAELVTERGSVLLVPNHDSQWDPVVLVYGLRLRRKVRFLARASLWKIFGVGPILNALHQIPIKRGAGDSDALKHAIEALSQGDAICIFPEGGLSRGEHVRPRSGVGRLAGDCAGARVLCCAISGTTDIVQFPRRPRIVMRIFEPASGQPRPEERPAELAERLMGEVREQVPPVPVGRFRKRRARARVTD